MRKHILACCLLLGACGESSTPDEASASGSTAAVKVLFSLEHGGSSPVGTLYVTELKTWWYTSREACKQVDGKLTDAELTELRGHLEDAMKQDGTDKRCPDNGYRLYSPTPRFVCWTDSKTPSTEALTKFFADRAGMLQWDHMPTECKTSPPPGIGQDTGHAGSGG